MLVNGTEIRFLTDNFGGNSLSRIGESFTRPVPGHQHGADRAEFQEPGSETPLWPVSGPPTVNEFYLHNSRPREIEVINTSESWVRQVHLFYALHYLAEESEYDELGLGDIPPQSRQTVMLPPMPNARVELVAYQFNDSHGSVWIREWNGKTHLAWFVGCDSDVHAGDEWPAALSAAQRSTEGLEAGLGWNDPGTVPG